MKLQYFIFLGIIFFVLLAASTVTAASFKYSNYSLEIDSGPGFWVLPNIDDSPLLIQRYLFVYEFQWQGNSLSFPAHQSLEGIDFIEASRQSRNYNMENFTTNLDNGAEIVITYYHYLTDQTIYLGSAPFQVSPKLLRVEYTINDWPYQNNQTQLGIHSYTSSATYGTTDVYGNSNTWKIYNDKYNISAMIVSQTNTTITRLGNTLSAPIDGSYTSKYIESGNTPISTGSGNNENITFDNFGIGFVGGSHTVTDMFYQITLNSSAFQPNYLVVVLQIVSVIGLGTGGVVIYKKLSNRVRLSTHSVSSALVSSSQQQIISDLFQSRSVLFYYLTGNVKIKDDEIDDKLQKAIPNDFYSFKFLMDPVRLSIVKLLYENLNMSTVELRDGLKIDWNKFNTHLSALKEKEYVLSEYVFSEGERKQMITLLPYGIEQFKVLTDLLHLFLDNISDIELGEYTADFDDSLFPEK